MTGCCRVSDIFNTLACENVVGCVTVDVLIRCNWICPSESGPEESEATRQGRLSTRITFPGRMRIIGIELKGTKGSLSIQKLLYCPAKSSYPKTNTFNEIIWIRILLQQKLFTRLLTSAYPFTLLGINNLKV
jgi:hypothetical protein